MTKFLEELTNFIFLEDKPRKADIIFVPGSEEGTLAVTAAELYRAGYAPYVMPSGKFAKWTGHCLIPGFETECDYFAHILQEEGVPEGAILRERESTYTYENAIYSRKLCDAQGLEIRRAILCPQAYHARRSKLYYQILFPDTEILVCPTITKGITRDNWFLDRKKIDIVLGEVERCGSQFHEIAEEYGQLEN
ncbi:MAG: YdcF family protein [Lachnospiraceae bacterium]